MVIDGNLDEKEWQKATVLEEFTTIVPFNFEDPGVSKQQLKFLVMLKEFMLDL